MRSKVQVKLNWVDKTVGLFSPKALLRRKKAKIFDALMTRKYEGADGGRRTSGWITNSSSANTEIAGALPRMRDRARDLVRNNPYAERAVEVIANNVVGRGLRPQIKVNNDRKTNRQEKRLNDLWRAWADTTACDFEGVNDFSGLQKLCIRSIVESGEVFIRLRKTRMRVVRGPDGVERPVPAFALQVLESDFVSTTRSFEKTETGNTINQGIELDTSGRVVAYHFYKSHPGGYDMFPGGSRYQTERIPAEDVIHLFYRKRPGQIRGMTWLSSIMIRLRDFDLYEDAQLKRQQCAAMFAAFVHDMEGLDEDAEDDEEVELGEKMEPGLIEFLPPGKEVTLSRPPGAENYGEYTSVVLHSIASGLGITYEQLTGNFNEVNFSSARMGFLESQRNFDSWRRDVISSRLVGRVFNIFLDEAELIGERTQGAFSRVTAPRREMIDPLKETEALAAAVRSGFKTQSDAIRELGNDPDAHYAEIEADLKILDEKGIVLDTDPRRVDKRGTSQESSSDSESEESGE